MSLSGFRSANARFSAATSWSFNSWTLLFCVSPGFRNLSRVCVGAACLDCTCEICDRSALARAGSHVGRCADDMKDPWQIVTWATTLHRDTHVRGQTSTRYLHHNLPHDLTTYGGGSRHSIAFRESVSYSVQ